MGMLGFGRMLMSGSGATVARIPAFSQVEYMIQQLAGDADVTDRSSNAIGLSSGSWTAAANTDDPPFPGGASVLLNGSNGWRTVSSAALGIGTADFCLEVEATLTAVSSLRFFADFRPAGNNGAYPAFFVEDGALKLYVSSAYLLSGGVVSTGVRHYAVLTRTSGVSRLYLGSGGVVSRVAIGADATNYGQSGLLVSQSTFGGSGIPGLLHRLRLTIGDSLGYTADEMIYPYNTAWPTS